VSRHREMPLNEHFFWTLIVMVAACLLGAVLVYLDAQNDPDTPAPVVCQTGWTCTDTPGPAPAIPTSNR
jgi:hypothetical protein